MNVKQILVISLAMVAGLACASGPTRSHKTPPGKAAWKITGQLVEACSCNGACPCWFGNMPTRMSCSGNQVIFIRSGRYGKVPLGGLAVAQFVKSPDGKKMMESFGNWDFDYVYIDDRANPAQRIALEEITKHLLAPGAKHRTIKYVRIDRRMKDKEFFVTVGNISKASGHLLGGGYAGTPTITNPPMADPTHKSYKQGVATRLTFSDAGQNWDFKGTNFMINEFTVDSAEYAKFEAEMAKKMKAMGMGG